MTCLRTQALYLTVSLAVALQPALAATKTFSTSAGAWLTAGNWSPSGVPTSSDDVLISGGTTLMTLTAANRTIQYITYTNTSSRILENSTGGTTASNLTLSGVDANSNLINVDSASGTATFTIRNGTTASLNLILGTSGNLNVTRSANSLTISSAISEAGGSRSLTKTGAGTLTFGGVNTYTGATTISGGTLILTAAGTIANTSKISIASGATFNTSAKTSGFTVGSSQSIGGAGTISAGTGGLKVSGTMGETGVSTLTVTGAGGTTFNADSIFSWNVTSESSFDKLVTAAISGGSATFDVTGATFSDSFWNSSKTFSNVIATSGGTGFDLATIFNTFKIDGVSTNSVSGRGSFAFDGANLNWTAVPEPTSALAGLLIGAGLLRRRRSA